MNKEIKHYKVKQLPSRPLADSVYWVKASPSSEVSGYITDLQGVPYPLKDISGSGGIQTITNTDGNISIVGSNNLVINISPALLSVINSALQSGDNISELINDAGYLTSFTETDPVFQASEASLFVAGDKANLDNQSGINSGDETTISIQTKRPLKTINGESLEGNGNVQIDYNDLDNLPTIPTVPNFADQTETNAGVVSDKTIAPNTLASWWTYVKGLAQTFAQKITFSSGALFSPQAQPTYEKGRIYFDNANDCISFMDSISGTSVQVGYEVLMRARNNTGATILNGSVVYISGAIGQNSTVALAQANTLPTSEIIGIATHDIANNTVGKICVFGLVNDLNTSSFTDGQMLYLSATVAGGLTSTIPASPNFVVALGVVEHAHPTQGKILVKPQRALANNNALGTAQNVPPTQNAVKTALDSKLDKVSTTGVERVYTINADGSQGTKPTSDFKDVLEFANSAAFPATGETEKIYIALDTNLQYRWSGSAYVQIGGGSGSETYIFEYAQPALPTTTNWQVSDYNSSKRDDRFRNNTATTYPTLNSDVGSHYIRKTGNITKIIFKMIRRTPGIAIDFDIYVAKFAKENGDIYAGNETIIANQNISSSLLVNHEAVVVEFTLLNTSVTEGEHLYIAFRNNTGITVTLFNPQIIIITE